MYPEFVSSRLLRLVDAVSGLLRKGCCDTTCPSKRFSRMRYVQYWNFSYTCTVGVTEDVIVLYVWGEYMYGVIWRTRWGSAAVALEWYDYKIAGFRLPAITNGSRCMGNSTALTKTEHAHYLLRHRPCLVSCDKWLVAERAWLYHGKRLIVTNRSSR
jgi:hypothetical protein